ncbi:MAG: hypothetical protein HC894_12865 [Microcoleus sp. SM1_3_4]|nr:hypothetical protein [Microcoleus sp. SM1_3_4]
MSWQKSHIAAKKLEAVCTHIESGTCWGKNLTKPTAIDGYLTLARPLRLNFDSQASRSLAVKEGSRD